MILLQVQSLIDEFNKVYGDEHRDESQDWHGQGYGESLGELKGWLSALEDELCFLNKLAEYEYDADIHLRKGKLESTIAAIKGALGE